MGKKGEPISPEDWWAQQQAEAEAAASLDAEGDDGGDGGDGGDGAALGAPSRGSGGTTKASAPAVPPAPLLILQIRTALDAIARDEVTGPAAATYSWDLRLYRPGLPAEGDGVLHLVVERAGPFDPVWAKAREAINQKQRLFEPGRALLTQEDLAAALRRARVR